MGDVVAQECAKLRPAQKLYRSSISARRTLGLSVGRFLARLCPPDERPYRYRDVFALHFGLNWAYA